MCSRYKQKNKTLQVNDLKGLTGKYIHVWITLKIPDFRQALD